MITIIHGEDIAASRNYYISEREKHQEKVILDGTSLTITQLLQAMSGNGLFGDQQTIFIEDLLSKRKPSKELDALLSELLATSYQRPATIFLYESKDLPTKQLKQFDKATIKYFPVPKTVFSFLESLEPKSGKKSLILFHQLLKDEDVNFALFMLQRQIRILLALASSVILSEREESAQDDKVISEVTRLAPWQKGKLQKQANTFSKGQLLHLHHQLYQLELGQKTGTLSVPLEQAIDFFLVSL